MKAALPPDVRKGSAFPFAFLRFSRLRLGSGGAASNNSTGVSERQSLSAHQAAEPLSCPLLLPQTCESLLESRQVFAGRINLFEICDCLCGSFGVTLTERGGCQTRKRYHIVTLLH
jgi:hypothetical protein